MMVKLKPISSIQGTNRAERQAKRRARPMRRGVAQTNPSRGPTPSPRRAVEAEELPLEPLTEGYSRRYAPMARMGDHLRIQAEEGYRAAIIELRPGLYLVGEVASSALQMQPEFGFAFLVPMMTNAAMKALTDPQATQATLNSLSQAGQAIAQPQSSQATYNAVSQAGLTTGRFLFEPASMHPVRTQAPHGFTQAPAPHQAPVAMMLAPAAPQMVMGYGPGWSHPAYAGWGRSAYWATEADISGSFGCEGCAQGSCPCRWRHP